jgi:N-carbamoyl-L-amino-acid hydrolase
MVRIPGRYIYGMHANASSGEERPRAEDLPITADDLAGRLAGLTPIGLSERGTNRLAWTPEDRRAQMWFREQAAEVGLRTEQDPAGNLWAVPPGDGPWWVVASHLDTVRDGGRLDGALGVAAGFAIARASSSPIAVVSFADEEGARFNTPTFGSRWLTGRLDVADVLQRTDEHGVELRQAFEAAGLKAEGLGQASAGLERVLGLIELHIDQSLDVVGSGQPAGIVTELASRLRLSADITGRADHSGTTRRGERADALAAGARLIVAALDLAPEDPDFMVTASRIIVEPNAATTIPARVRLWLDARSPQREQLVDWQQALEARAEDVARRGGVELRLDVASQGPGVAFDLGVNAALHEASERLGHPAPAVVCFAGHDAGIVAPHRPAGMVLVRNATGVSHSPAEHVELEDAAYAANVVLTAVERLI